MTNSIVQFQFGFNDIRVASINDEPWLVAKDVCDVLGIKNHRDACERLDDDEKDVATADTLGGSQEMVVISESGFYRLVMTSRKPEVKKFQKWVTSEVIPSIRKTGSYSIPAPIPQLPSRELAVETAVAIDRIQDILSKSNPRLAQILIDHAMNDVVDSSRSIPASQEFPEDKWYGLVQIAGKMGIKTDLSSRVKLGQSIGKRVKELNLERVREERLCNGQHEEIWCYRDNDVVRKAIQECADAK